MYKITRETNDGVPVESIGTAEFIRGHKYIHYVPPWIEQPEDRPDTILVDRLEDAVGLMDRDGHKLVSFEEIPCP